MEACLSAMGIIWAFLVLTGFLLMFVPIPGNVECNCVQLLDNTTQAICNTQLFLLPCPPNATGVLCSNVWANECGQSVYVAGIVCLSIAAPPFGIGALFLGGLIVGACGLGMWDGCKWVWNRWRRRSYIDIQPTHAILVHV